jgi:dihydrolipoamide dehydrogenase
MVDGDGARTFSADNIMIAVGGRPQRLPEYLMNVGGVYTSDDILGESPISFKHVLIIGAGVIALEFASFYRDMGCEVTVVARSTVLRKMDREISQNVVQIMKKRGVRFESGASIKNVEKTGDNLKCVFVQNDKELIIECDGIIAAMGRTVDLANLFSGMEPVEIVEGTIVINGNCQTSIPNIYAIGDCTEGSVQLAHAASAQGINAISHIVGDKEHMCVAAIPSCMYTDPEVAVVGLSADDAKNKGIPTKTGKYIMSVNAKSILSYQDRGFIKVVFNAENDEIIGAQLMCARATDIIAELTTAISNKLKVHDMSKVIRPHPTFVDGVSEAVEDVCNLAVHMMPKKKV